MLEATPPAAAAFYEHYRFRDGLMEVMNLARAANKYFNDSEPWKTASSDRERCATTIHISLQVARTLAVLMSPVIPASCERIWRMLGLPGEAARASWDSAGRLALEPGHRLGTAGILFTKIEDSMIEPGGAVPPGTPAAPGPAEPEKITIDDFRKVDLRVGKVLRAEPVPKSEKLLKLQVEIGTEQRQIVAGIARQYRSEDLVGKLVVVVYNLRPSTLMKEESHGMVLAASGADGKLVIVSPESEILSGAAVK